MTALVVAISLLAGIANLANASPQLGSCLIYERSGNKLAEKSCSLCQQECFSDPGQCTGLDFDSTYVSISSLPFWNCGDDFWLKRSPGLCVLFESNGDIFDVQQQDCTACLQQCSTDSRCNFTVFNYQRVEKYASTCAAGT